MKSTPPAQRIPADAQLFPEQLSSESSKLSKNIPSSNIPQEKSSSGSKKSLNIESGKKEMKQKEGMQKEKQPEQFLDVISNQPSSQEKYHPPYSL